MFVSEDTTCKAGCAVSLVGKVATVLLLAFCTLLPYYVRTMTKTIKASVARQQFSKVLNDVFRQENRVLVEKSGIPVAAIIPAKDLQLLARLEAERNKDFAILDEMREAFKDVPAEEIEREVARAISEVRKENRTKQSPATP
jgi:prevent-host-death family protein